MLTNICFPLILPKGQPATVLQFLKMTVTSNICPENASFLCAKGVKKASRTCKGDSGSPMVFNNILVGLVVGGYTDCIEYRPDRFVNISYFYLRIKNEIEKL